jgi:hypothetical protein
MNVANWLAQFYSKMLPLATKGSGLDLDTAGSVLHRKYYLTSRIRIRNTEVKIRIWILTIWSAKLEEVRTVLKYSMLQNEKKAIILNVYFF